MALCRDYIGSLTGLCRDDLPESQWPRIMGYMRVQRSVVLGYLAFQANALVSLPFCLCPAGISYRHETLNFVFLRGS